MASHSVQDEKGERWGFRWGRAECAAVGWFVAVVVVGRIILGLCFGF